LKPAPGYVASATRRGIAFAPSGGMPVIAIARFKEPNP
jgi:hypothetical protein